MYNWRLILIVDDTQVISQVFPVESARVLSRVNLTRYNLHASDALLTDDVS